MRQSWTDDRLKLANGHSMTLSGNPKDLIWLPDLYIRNSLEIKKHTTGFTETARTTISSNGHIHISSRYFSFDSLQILMMIKFIM